MPPKRNPTPRFDYLARLEENIERDANGCWIWQASLNAAGYGRWKHRSIKTRLAYRIVYEMLVGPVPEGLELDHLCRVRACVNPAHLEPVDHYTNMRRGALATKQYCANGHERIPENEYLTTDRFGARRRCKQCAIVATRRYQARKQAEAQ